MLISLYQSEFQKYRDDYTETNKYQKFELKALVEGFSQKKGEIGPRVFESVKAGFEQFSEKTKTEAKDNVSKNVVEESSNFFKSLIDEAGEKNLVLLLCNINVGLVSEPNLKKSYDAWSKTGLKKSYDEELSKLADLASLASKAAMKVIDDQPVDSTYFPDQNSATVFKSTIPNTGSDTDILCNFIYTNFYLYNSGPIDDLITDVEKKDSKSRIISSVQSGAGTLKHCWAMKLIPFTLPTPKGEADEEYFKSLFEVIVNFLKTTDCVDEFFKGVYAGKIKLAREAYKKILEHPLEMEEMIKKGKFPESDSQKCQDRYEVTKKEIQTQADNFFSLIPDELILEKIKNLSATFMDSEIAKPIKESMVKSKEILEKYHQSFKTVELDVPSKEAFSNFLFEEPLRKYFEDKTPYQEYLDIIYDPTPASKELCYISSEPEYFFVKVTSRNDKFKAAKIDDVLHYDTDVCGQTEIKLPEISIFQNKNEGMGAKISLDKTPVNIKEFKGVKTLNELVKAVCCKKESDNKSKNYAEYAFKIVVNFNNAPLSSKADKKIFEIITAEGDKSLTAIQNEYLASLEAEYGELSNVFVTGMSCSDFVMGGYLSEWPDFSKIEPNYDTTKQVTKNDEITKIGQFFMLPTFKMKYPKNANSGLWLFKLYDKFTENDFVDIPKEKFMRKYNVLPPSSLNVELDSCPYWASLDYSYNAHNELFKKIMAAQPAQKVEVTYEPEKTQIPATKIYSNDALANVKLKTFTIKLNVAARFWQYSENTGYKPVFKKPPPKKTTTKIASKGGSVGLLI